MCVCQCAVWRSARVRRPRHLFAARKGEAFGLGGLSPSLRLPTPGVVTVAPPPPPTAAAELIAAAGAVAPPLSFDDLARRLARSSARGDGDDARGLLPLAPCRLPLAAAVAEPWALGVPLGDGEPKVRNLPSAPRAAAIAVGERRP